MKFRFAVEFEMPYVTNPEHAERLLHNLITEGLSAFGHTAETLPFKIVKLRSRTVKDMEEDKP